MGYREDLERVVRAALAEDVGSGDVTTWALISRDRRATAEIRADAKGVIAGIDAARAVFSRVDRGLRFRPSVRDGARVRPGRIVARVRGRLGSILTGERAALNFLQQLSGVATLTRAFVERTRGTRAKIFDTRKTVPGLRRLQKRAVRAGGGRNHRTGLFDAGLIKENHIAGTKDLEAGLRRLRRKTRWIEIEAQTVQEAKHFALLPVDAVLLDNFSVATLRKLVRWIRARRPGLALEASGGVKLATVRAIARTGIDRISVGALTHSPPALDLSLDVAS